MIPPPVDPALLREHAFEDNKALDIVLDPRTSISNGGYKPIKDYGMGYFNYIFGAEHGIDKITVKDLLRDHIYRHFNLYFFLWLVLFVVWVVYVFGAPKGLDSAGRWKRKKTKKKSDDDTDTMFHHMKV